MDQDRIYAILANANVITISDRLNYEPGKDENGGHYETWQTFRPDPKNAGRWIKEHHVSHDWGVCPACGELSHAGEDCPWGGKPRDISLAVLFEKIVFVEFNKERARYIDEPRYSWGATFSPEYVTKLKRKIVEAMDNTILQSELLDVANILHVSLR